MTNTDTAPQIAAYQQWRALDGSRTVSVNSVGTRGDDQIACGLDGNGYVELTFAELRRNYEFVTTF